LGLKLSELVNDASRFNTPGESSFGDGPVKALLKGLALLASGSMFSFCDCFMVVLDVPDSHLRRTELKLELLIIDDILHLGYSKHWKTVWRAASR